MRWGNGLLLATGAMFAGATPAVAQRAIHTDRDTIRFDLPTLRVMLDTARALYRDLEEDPRVLYSLGFGPPAELGSMEPAYPWNAVSPTSDSTVNIVTPGNFREADRAYHNYAVMRMRVVRELDPDASCETLMQAEEEVLSSYVDGWILARTLFGGPAFAPMDELVFAREANLLRPLLAAHGNTSIGVCSEEWAAEHPDEISAYETWRAMAFPELATLATDSDVEAEEPEEVAGSPEEAAADPEPADPEVSAES